MKSRHGVSSVLLLAALALCWSGALDRIAQQEAQAALARVVVAFGVSRTLNGLISVAQGTEIALQPAGVGVTLTAGEILDPLNDLVERFSLLALAASVSLGTQLLLTELLSHTWLNVVLTLLVGVYFLTIWLPSLAWAQRIAARTVALAICVRLAVALVMFGANWLGNLSLVDKHTEAMAELTATQAELRALNDGELAAHLPEGAATPEDPTAEPPADEGLFDRLGTFFKDQRETLDLRARLTALQERAENAVTHLITLCVIFLLQYLALPIGAFWLALAGLRTTWQLWLRPTDRSTDPG